MTVERQVLTVPEAATVLGMHETTIYRQLADGTFPLPVRKIGGRWKISRYQLDRFLSGDDLPAISPLGVAAGDLDGTAP
jgi:excisionase family DNA binding protein